MSTISTSTLKMAVSASAQADHLRNTQSQSNEPSDHQKLVEVANQFEALFVKSFLSSARSAQLADSLLNNEGSRTFYSMLDSEYANALAQRQSLGIADGLVHQFKDRVQGKGNR